ncbi:glycosyltransferase family 39 protein [Candidatus Gottesmanbacteria bacterium]|nr:glycosyltransferase family 39 protein [Candidatus Gottesmanbacteria bacterium]
MKNFIIRYFGGIIIAMVFFVVGVATLSDYGINIDEPIHFIRGQAYLHLLTTGQYSYRPSNLIGPRVSAWKIQQYNGQYFLKNDGGHPALNGIIAALSNRILYEKLGIMGDLESYHAFEVLVAGLLVFLVFVMGRDTLGAFAGGIAALALALYPLFLGESRFNIKDPVETAFFAGTVYFFYLGITKNKASLLLWSAFLCGLALSTKFNIVFVPFMLLPYLIICRPTRFFTRRMILSFLLFPAIVFLIFYSSWPYLWSDPIGRLRDTIMYYKGIGTGNANQPSFLFYGWNMYPPFFVVISTPLVSLLFAVVGFVGVLTGRFKEKSRFVWLVVFWLCVPIVRVMWPGASIYSGVRQILEYLPALVLLTGFGAHICREVLVKITGRRFFSSVVIVLLFVPTLLTMMRMHPNENLFLNSLIGGVSGAVAHKIPGAAESMGNVYLQGIRWLNKHAEQNARVGLPVGLLSNIPGQYIRKDIRFGAYFSALRHEGEYMMEMVSVDFPPPRYNFLYLNQMMNPVDIISVEGIPVLKIWKNEATYFKPELSNEMIIPNVDITGGRNEGFIKIRLDRLRIITRIEVDHNTLDCSKADDGGVQYIADGENLIRMEEDMRFFKSIYGQYQKFYFKPNTWYYFFPATMARMIDIVPNDFLSCILSYIQVRVYGPKGIEKL